MPTVDRSSVRMSPPQRSIATYARPRPHQHADCGQAREPHQREPPAPKGSYQRQAPENDQKNRCRSWAPVLLEGIGAEEDEAVLLDDEAPAGAARILAGARVRAPHRLDERPVEHRQDGFPKKEKQKNGKRRAAPPGEQVLAQPLHRSAIRALYQFMSAEIERLIVRYTAMMIATPSIACPVWLMAVLATDTRSG